MAEDDKIHMDITAVKRKDKKDEDPGRMTDNFHVDEFFPAEEKGMHRPDEIRPDLVPGRTTLLVIKVSLSG